MVMKETNGKKKVAIACQGGGSHTAFTAGVLKKILEEQEQNGKYEIIGLSGTSGGAICALLTWYGLLTNDKDKAIKLLDSFWRDISARSFDDMLVNEWVVWTSRLHGTIPMVDINPYYYPPVAQERMRSILNRLVDFDKLKTLINDSSPDLLVGAADVLSGEFKVFWNPDIDVDTILASAAIPTLLRAIRTDGKVYWDGLFSQNPPIRSFIEDTYLFSWDNIPGDDNGKLIEFLTRKFGIDWVKTAKIEKIDDGKTIRVSTEKNPLWLKLNDEKTKVNLETDDGRTYEFVVSIENEKLNIYEDTDIHEKPDEIWIIHINPQKRHYEPKSIREIEDRRNELSGNLSLYQEIDFIENVNKWVEKGYLPSETYKPIKVRWIERLREDLDVASKLDRDPQFIQDMMNHGEERAEKFLKQLT